MEEAAATQQDLTSTRQLLKRAENALHIAKEELVVSLKEGQRLGSVAALAQEASQASYTEVQAITQFNAISTPLQRD